MSHRINKFSEIHTGQQGYIKGQNYVLEDIWVIVVDPPTRLLTMANFESLDRLGSHPDITVNVETILFNPLFSRRAFNPREELEKWIAGVPGGISIRLRNILIAYIDGEYRGGPREIHPLYLSKRKFLSLRNAGKVTLEEYERALKSNPIKRVKAKGKWKNWEI